MYEASTSHGHGKGFGPRVSVVRIMRLPVAEDGQIGPGKFIDPAFTPFPVGAYVRLEADGGTHMSWDTAFRIFMGLSHVVEIEYDAAWEVR